jgi:hypothetical protein
MNSYIKTEIEYGWHIPMDQADELMTDPRAAIVGMIGCKEFIPHAGPEYRKFGDIIEIKGIAVEEDGSQEVNDFTLSPEGFIHGCVKAVKRMITGKYTGPEMYCSRQTYAIDYERWINEELLADPIN